MSIHWRTFRKEVLPRPGNTMLLVIAAGTLLIGFICALSMAFSSDLDDPLGVAAMVLGAMTAPLATVLVIIAGFRDKRPAPRALLLFAAAALLATGGLITAVGMSTDPELGIPASSAVFAVVCGPLVLLLFAPAVYYARKAWPQLRTALRDARADSARAFVDLHGMASYAEIGREVGLGMDETTQLLAGLAAMPRASMVVYPDQLLVFGERELDARLRRMRAVVQARGQIVFEDLAAELDVPRAMVKDWLYRLVEAGRFSGHINWDEGTLYSEQASKLQQAGRCPHCSGELQLAGQGVISCPFCGAEVFV